jgi:hypothetical protein
MSFASHCHAAGPLGCRRTIADQAENDKWLMSRTHQQASLKAKPHDDEDEVLLDRAAPPTAAAAALEPFLHRQVP